MFSLCLFPQTVDRAFVIFVGVLASAGIHGMFETRVNLCLVFLLLSRPFLLYYVSTPSLFSYEFLLRLSGFCWVRASLCWHYIADSK